VSCVPALRESPSRYGNAGWPRASHRIRSARRLHSSIGSSLGKSLAPPALECRQGSLSTATKLFQLVL
jgi:hypothetical protein